MGSTFRGLETGKSGINVAMLNMEVAGQNIANADTPGYTRQRVIQVAKAPPGSRYVVSQVYNKMAGQGADILGIQQLRSEYLDMQYRNLNSTRNYYESRSQAMDYLTGVLNELDEDASISNRLDAFASAMSRLAEEPSSEEYRLNLQQSGVSLTETIGYVYDEMVDLARSQAENLDTTAQAINMNAVKIAALNTAIASYERTGQSANELKDERNLLLDQLAGLVNIEYKVSDQNESMVDVSIGGVALVTGRDANQIDIQPAAAPNDITGITSYTLTLDGVELHSKYTGDPADANVTGGELFSQMEMLENATETNPGIPYYVSRLDDLAQTIAKTVNNIHAEGYTYPDAENGHVSQRWINFFEVPAKQAVDGNGDPLFDAGGNPVYVQAKDANGDPLFDGNGNPVYEADYSQVTGGNLSLSKEVLSSVWNIAASDKPVDLNAATTNSGNAIKILAIQHAFESGEVYGTLNSFVVHLGIAANACDGLLHTTESLINSVDNQRDSISSVSLGEEATNIIMYKQSYNASARVISSIDEMLDKLINGTGRVGL